MRNDRLDDILSHLEALDRRLARLEGPGYGHGSDHDEPRRHQRDRDRDHGHSDDERGRDGNDFDEKRVVDLIVRLVGEKVERIVQRELDERFDLLRKELARAATPAPPTGTPTE